MPKIIRVLFLVLALAPGRLPEGRAAENRSSAPTAITPAQMRSFLLKTGFGADLSSLKTAFSPAALSSLAGEQSAPAQVLAAALVDPAFLKNHQAALEPLLGGPAAIQALQQHHARPEAAGHGLDASAVVAKAQAWLSAAGDGTAFDGRDQGRGEDARLRSAFNAQYPPERYEQFLSAIETRAGERPKWRVSDTPIFFETPLIEKMARYGKELLPQLTAPTYRAAAAKAIPAEFRVPSRDEHPTFIVVDFGLVEGPDGRLEPKLVELQGFPGLYAFAPVLADAHIAAHGLDHGLTPFLGGLDRKSYASLLKRAILGNHDPENVVLMEIDPSNQSTSIDFTMTEKLAGVKAVDIREIKKDGRELYYERDGRRISIKRIYNRAIVDELVRRQISSDFRFTDDVDVEWAGNPNWFFEISKFSLPFLKHESVPRSRFLDQAADAASEVLESSVLKPLFSFGGNGVNLHPTRADIDAIPQDQRWQWVLQDRMRYVPFIETPFGMTKAEVRIMYIWLEELIPAISYVRMGRGEMMNVGKNKEGWAGSTVGLYRPGP